MFPLTTLAVSHCFYRFKIFNFSYADVTFLNEKNHFPALYLNFTNIFSLDLLIVDRPVHFSREYRRSGRNSERCIIDHIKRGNIYLSNSNIVVLDDADEEIKMRLVDKALKPFSKTLAMPSNKNPMFLAFITTQFWLKEIGCSRCLLLIVVIPQ